MTRASGPPAAPMALVPLRTAAGTFHAVLSADGVCCLSFPHEPDACLSWLSRHALRAAPRGYDPRAQPLAEELDAYLHGELREFSLPPDLRGTAFQVQVWRELQAIPYGGVRSYGQVATAIGRPAAVRAVGAANGANPVPVVVPCHRVIGSSGDLVGFGGGLDWKRRLLAIEARGREEVAAQRSGPSNHRVRAGKR